LPPESVRSIPVPKPRTIVIVGASLAGAKAAETLRNEGFDGRVVLLGEERDRPYERPLLSKDYLRGDADRSKVYIHDATFYADQGIELRTGTKVVALDADHRIVVLDDGEELGYDRLLLTTGAVPRPLQVPGADLDGVHQLRSLADADRLGRALRNAGSVAVVGAGWIGCEVAASARQRGRPVTMIDPSAVPLQRALGLQVGAIYRDLHAGHGVQLHLGTGVESLHGDGRVEQVRLTDGSRVTADLVVVGVGAVPRVGLATAAGLQVDNGVATDDHLRTSAPNVFAAGDVAAAFHPTLGARIRVEHWANALHQGPAAARNMLGLDTVYDRMPYFYSDQYELGMEFSGRAAGADRIVFRGDPADGKFIAFWLAHGVVVAGMNANVWDVTDPIQRLIRERAAVHPDRLADPDTPLETLADQSRSRPPRQEEPMVGPRC